MALANMSKLNQVKSKKIFAQSEKVLVGGVNSPVRAFGAIGGNPIIVKEAHGGVIKDEDNNAFIDLCQSWGASILGHANSKIVQAIQAQARIGTSYGTTTAKELEIAKVIQSRMPWCQRLRFVSSGTEATMSAIRLARGYTAKEKIIKFEGCYHGHSDSLLVKAGSGLATLGKPSSKGIPIALAKNTIVLPFNNNEALAQAFKKHKDIACVIVEPIAGNMGVIPASKSFLKQLREHCTQNQTLLIFDEVITGFRVHPQGATAYFNIKPDLVCLGKIIGGGLPIGAFGGRARIMECLSPIGDVYQAGTLSGNPLSIAAGLAVLNQLKQPNFYTNLDKKTHTFTNLLKAQFIKNGVPIQIPQIGSMFCLFFQNTTPREYSDITQAHINIYQRFFHHMLESGIYLPPSAYEALFLTQAHTQTQLNAIIKAASSFTIH